ncbi:transporter [Caulobacter sp. BK020]|uniref:transporter n=1 Tax=Caulobacter sp. BK020 TaxID=2512117 RepID=UPI0010D3EEE1|nr:transporter [Caulobacter sp. BK020]TCS12313.1 outer membrane putative beta-barrel porin/alpha-amylase [Caulobacter sp. BK020]
MITNAPRGRLALVSLLAGVALAAPAFAQDAAPVRQSLDDAWWTGPILATGASTLPKGRALIEPYLYDAKPYGAIDGQGKRHAAPSADNYGSQTYLLYGVTDTFTAGLIPRFGYRRAGGRSSSGVQLGDLTVQGQYRLAQWKEGGRTPTLSLMLQETLPTGRHDRLDTRPNDGFGSGAYATTVGLNSQTYFWTPNGRILRTRLNVAYTVSGHAEVEGASVYGTPAGFTGRARPGDSFNVDLAFEYSMTRRWVAALDLAYQRDAATTVSGVDGAGAAYERRAPVSQALILAPAIEYNFSPAVGVIVGARIIPAGRNVTASVTPVIAVNYVL